MSGNRYDDLVVGSPRERPPRQRRQDRGSAPGTEQHAPSEEPPVVDPEESGKAPVREGAGPTGVRTTEPSRSGSTSPEKGRETARSTEAAGVPALDEESVPQIELTTPGGLEEWLHRSLNTERRPKDYHAPAISEYHAELLDQDQRVLKQLGFSRRQCSLGNLIELAIELQHEQLAALNRTE